MNKSENTKGTQMAASVRAKTNRLSDEERQRYMGKALERIYKGGSHAKTRAHRC